MSSWIRKMGKAAAMGLGMILVLMLACGAFAEEVAEEPAVVETVTTVSVSPEAKISDREAASGYISQIMKGAFAKPGKTTLNASRGGGVARSQLTGREANVYDALKPLILEVAAGQRASTVFTLSRDDVYGDEKTQYTAQELGVSAILGSDTKPTAEAAEAFYNKTKVDYSLVIDSLLADCPYELYWYDKTKGAEIPGMGYKVGYNTDYYMDVPNTFKLSFRVSANYSPNNVIGGYTVDTTYGTAATTAAENARQVVEINKNRPDYQKLHAYKNYICGAVDYNRDAVDNPPPYGDPWQLIWVFDGDETTKVVCEGYSKAFQFLCDESDFTNTSVISVSGYMSGGTGAGNHMWNIVTMGDGYHYLADITNSDDGTIGDGGELFIKGYTVKVPDTDNAYAYLAGGEYVTYVYDDDTIALLESTGRLAVVGQADLPTVSVTAHGDRGQDVTLSFANPAAGSDVDLYWEIFYAVDENTAESVQWDEFRLNAGSSREITLIGSNFLKAGDYQVLLYVNPGEWIDPEELELVSAADFTLADGDLPTISVSLENSSVTDGESVNFTASSGDGTVEAVAVHSYGWDPFLNESTWGYGMPTDPSDEGDSGTIPYEEPGLMKAQVWGRVNGVWSQPVEITVEVYGQLGPATITSNSPIQVGENAVFEIQVDPRAMSGSSWRLTDSESNVIQGESWVAIPEDGLLTVTVPESCFDDPGSYLFTFSQNGGQYLERNETVLEFIVEGSSRPDAPDVSWSAVEGYPNDTLYVNVDTAGVSLVELKFESEINRMVYEADGESTTIPVTLNLDTAAACTVRVMIDGVWSRYADAVTLIVHEPTPPSDWAPGVPETIVPGEDVVVHFDPVEGAVSYNVGVWNDYGYPIYTTEVDLPGDVVIPASLFFDGGSFDLGIGVSDGVHSDWLWKDVFYTVEPYHPENRPLTAGATQSEYDDIRDVTFTLSAEAPEKVFVQQYYDEYEYGTHVKYWDTAFELDHPGATFRLGDYITHVTSDLLAWYSGDLRFRFIALVDGAWTDCSNTVLVTVAQSGEDLTVLAAPRVTLSASSVTEDEAVTVSWNAVDQATGYTVIGLGQEIRTEETSYTVAAGTLSPGIYQIWVRAEGPGCQDSEQEVLKLLTVTESPIDPSEFTNVLNLPASLTAIESQAFADLINVEAVRIPATVTAIAPDAFSGSNITILAPAGSYAADWAAEHNYPVVLE